MGSKVQPLGSVFVSYARVDRERVRPLVRFLSTRFSVWWDEEIEPGTSWRYTIQQQLYEAACVVVVWTSASVFSEFVWTEAQPGKDRGVLVPVLLDAGAVIPVGFSALQYVDLTRWEGADDSVVRPLMSRVQRLVKRGLGPGYARQPLPTDSGAVDHAMNATSEMQGLTAQLKSIGEVLLPGSTQVAGVLGALREVSKTYEVVNAAIEEFVAPAVETGPIASRPFVEMERGLSKKIRDGKGHCSRILTYYGMYGGIRDWLKDKMAADEFAKVNSAFERLGTADGDLFWALVEIGEVLTQESRSIVNLVAARQQDAARARILAGRKTLEPLEQKLAGAMTEMQQLEESLGYAE
jgi:hypothetical protein